MRLFSGQGKVYIGQYSAPYSLSYAGNCSSFILRSVDADAVRQMTDTQAQASDILPDIPDSQSFVARIDEYTADILANVLAATRTTVVRATGQTVGFVSTKGFTYALGTVMESVTSVQSAGPVTYTAGTDYVINSSSITIPSGSTIVNGTACTVNYTKSAHERIMPMTGDWLYRKMLIEGINTADSHKVFNIQVFKFKLQFMMELPLISDDYASFEMVGHMMPDVNNSNRYYEIQQVE